MKKIILSAVALATMAATPALASDYRSRAAANAAMASDGYVQRGTSYGEGAYAASPVLMSETPGVYSYGRYAGWDPDPSIRLQLRRDPTGGDAQ